MEATPELSSVMLAAIEQTAEAVFITDTKGAILYVNRAFEDLTGYLREEAVGKNARILKSGLNSPALYSDMWNTLKAGRSWNGRLINRRKDGSTYLDEQHNYPITDSRGQIKYFLAQRHDITRELQLEAQLNQSQKMESLGLLAGQISHDFNNLLTIIIGSMELICEDLKPGSVGARLTSEILRSSKESAGLIKQLMVFARRQEAHPVVTTLNEPLGELRILLDSLLGKGVSVTYSLAGAPAKVSIEPEHFKQAVMNLAVNARDAMNGSGGISIKTFNSGPDGLPPSLTQGQYAVFEISDTGPGIPKEVLPRIFEPFFTTKPKGKGTGLGLSTVYGIVSQNKGLILPANLPEGGAVFTIYFPVVK